jgi:restriction endonuclease
MDDLPELVPDHFEILVLRELRKVGLAVSELRLHRRATLPEPARGYVLEFKGVVSGPEGPRRVLIACRRQPQPIVRADVESLRDQFKDAGVEAGLLFAATDFDPDALSAAERSNVVLLRVTDGRTAFDTSGWGTPGHYPAWLPVYCAQIVERDPIGRPRYQLLEGGQADPILRQLRTEPSLPRKGTPA